jgi:hypothetical protein
MAFQFNICPTSDQVMGSSNPLSEVSFERVFRNQYSKFRRIHYNLDKVQRNTVLTQIEACLNSGH